eukprot:TRINITY_DN23115_c0_g1_i2.p1 TRINITY_DN23115_c0_g1~~TRINITY_DN23115_c0_g1_i2.p1  ORF type:complete len:253 (-),score=63.35 TRINITY_DN23115_c0_g1_i2:39-797(-)
MAVLCPLFFVVILPFAAVDGDATYMPRTKLFRLEGGSKPWKAASVRKATVLNTGPLHANPDNVFLTLVVEVLAKSALPVIVILTTSMPRVQMTLVSSIGFIMFGVSVLYLPTVSMKACYFIQGLRLYTLCTMICGLVTVCLDRGSLIPLAFLGVCTLVVPLGTALRIRNADMVPPDVQRCTTSAIVEQAPVDSFGSLVPQTSLDVSMDSLKTNNAAARLGSSSSMTDQFPVQEGILRRMGIFGKLRRVVRGG